MTQRDGSSDGPRTGSTSPNSDIAPLPGSDRDVQEGVAPLTVTEQLEQLHNFIEVNYPDIFQSITTDAGAPYTSAGAPVSASIKEDTERMWAKLPDLLTHSSLLVLGAGLDHSMPHVAFTRSGISAVDWDEVPGLPALPEGVRATVCRPDRPSGAVAISLYGGPGWCGDGLSHEQLWLPLFAALAQQSGVTVVDVVYPLPAEGSTAATQAAVGEVWNAVRDHRGLLGGDANNGASTGVIAFGSGFVAGAKVLGEADWIVALSPRVPEGFAVDLSSPRVMVSLAQRDTRATPEEEVRAFCEEHVGHAEFHSVVAEHFIAPPSVWRERVEHLGRWMSQLDRHQEQPRVD
ncbi:hypothetical protein [Corynebacterium heidelbergense]|uniref:Alpha/beta hydrolase n=1 Tax=Corynebacterium heidelbergense TaxID=2055947 RepID=A0A364V3Q4_9CORY|nr:hypothetical protein [Corynebacterium heidelbergense]RAV31263.1 hypothetical protein DLJ54_09295 [Corynebacterium heidelbergense]